MSWLALHPQGIADRAKGSGAAKPGLTLLESVALGSIGFMFVSVAGFVPWAFAGRALHHAVGEVGLYAVCAVVFIGPGSLWRIYRFFSIAFTAYAVWLLGHLRKVFGVSPTGC